MFEYVAPATIEEACAFLLENPGARPMLGGTDLLVKLRAGRVSPDYLVDLKRIPGLDQIDDGPAGGLTIGAAVTLNRLIDDPRVADRFPVLHEALSKMAAYPVRNRATLAGNLANASPAADGAPPLIVLDATVEIAGPGGAKTLPVAELFLGPGKAALDPGELITRVTIPGTYADWPGFFGRQARRKALDLAMVSVAIIGSRDTGTWSWRIAAGAVGPTPMRLTGAEGVLARGEPTDLLIAEAATAAAFEVSPITDVRGREAYRRAMVKAHTRRGLTTLRDRLEESK